eukprot:1139184-Pelagomonas_calceolata.AAC.3
MIVRYGQSRGGILNVRALLNGTRGHEPELANVGWFVAHMIRSGKGLAVWFYIFKKQLCWSSSPPEFHQINPD